MEKVDREPENSSLTSPQPVTPPDCANPGQVKLSKPEHLIIRRGGFGTAGHPISLLANHFQVSVKCSDTTFYQYSVSISSEKGTVKGNGIGKKIINKLCQTYSSELAGKSLVYDGEGCLYTVGPLPKNNLEFTVLLEELFTICEPGKRLKRSLQSKSFTVEIIYATRIPMKSILLALEGVDCDTCQDALKVLNVILRQQASNRNFNDIGGGVTACRGFHSSFHLTHCGLSLNMDVSTTVILTPGPVINFLLANQNAPEPRHIDWKKAKRMLKNMRVKAQHNNMEFKIVGLSEKPCNQQFFPLKVKNDDGEGQTTEITVYEYFRKCYDIELTYSAYMPCLDVGKLKRPTYLPIELCSLVSLQRYTRTLSSAQRASLIEKSRQKPHEKKQAISAAFRSCCYDNDPTLLACGISIDKQLTQVDGRVLDAPKLNIGNSEDFSPSNGRWNFHNKQFLMPVRIERWAIVNFSARCDTSHLSREFINCGRSKGIHIERPQTLIEEDAQYKKAGPAVRVEKMFEQLMQKISRPPQFLLCVLSERKNSDIYGPWKKTALCDFGIVTQCLSPVKITDQYLTNVLLKINTKLGGTNSLLAIERSCQIPLVNDTPTMILGMDVSHGSIGRSDIPSIAAVVGSLSWPLISKYRSAVRTQSSRVEMIESLFKPLANGEDDGIMRELLVDFYQTSQGRKPTQIVVFRDGVSESQFSQVLNSELDQMIKAYQNLGETDIPKFTVVVAQKKHHMKLFRDGSSENVPPGTVVDTKVVHPRDYDFYMCAHSGMIGTPRPVHYHVLIDEIGFSPDGLQNLIHSLSYVNQRSTNATSIVAPVRYAHLAAEQMGKFLSWEEVLETSSGQKSVTSAENANVPELPRLHEDVERSMFFC